MHLSFLVLIQLVIFCCLKHLKDRMFHLQIGKSVEFAFFHFFVFETAKSYSKSKSFSKDEFFRKVGKLNIDSTFVNELRENSLI